MWLNDALTFEGLLNISVDNNLKVDQGTYPNPVENLNIRFLFNPSVEKNINAFTR